MEFRRPGYTVYNAGLVNPRVTSAFFPYHHVLCGLLRRESLYDVVLTSIRSSASTTFIRCWSYPFVDERLVLNGGQMENLGFVPPHWPFGYRLEQIPLQTVI